MKKLTRFLLLLMLCLGLYGCGMPIEDYLPDNFSQEDYSGNEAQAQTPAPTKVLTKVEKDEKITTDFSLLADNITLDAIPEYSTEAYAVINGNEPFFTVDTSLTESFEFYSELDSLGRCGITYANIGKDIMPTEERGSIGSVKPTGWQTVKYDCVDGKYLYNRCHLIGFQLTGENANKQNLITGTRYMNVDGMLPFENMVADYVKETGNHVMYRVLPLYDGDNLVAQGVLMEAWSVEDEGEGICFNVFVYNIQPGVEIDYATGNSWLSGETVPTAAPTQAVTSASEEKDYVLNVKTKKFHYPSCSSAASLSDDNRVDVTCTRQELIDEGYEACGRCKP